MGCWITREASESAHARAVQALARWLPGLDLSALGRGGVQ